MAPTHGTREQPAGKGGSVAMKTLKKTPPEAPDGAQRYGRVRSFCEPHFHEFTPPRREGKPKLRPKSARSRRAGSRYQPGSAYRPPKETLAKCQREVLAVLKKAGPDGVTRLEAPDHLQMSWPQRISELRKKGYRIDSKRERVGDARIARYVLVATKPVPQAEAKP